MRADAGLRGAGRVPAPVGKAGCPAARGVQEGARGVHRQPQGRGAFSPELRIHKLVNTEIWSLTWAKDGRALFRYGSEIAEGETHIVWEAIGTHAEVYDFKK
jgi:hypothetical protein